MNESRWGIVVLYDPDNVISESDIYLLREVSTVVDRLIVVVNTDAEVDVFKIRQFTDEIIIRPNRGFDGGAVKHVICSYLCNLKKEFPEELLICNNSFFGPFIPMEQIFDDMSGETCDYWGISGQRKEYTALFYGVDSYFWVFRKRILSEGKFADYLNEYIDEDTKDFWEICACYENGINEFLSRFYEMGLYSDQKNLNIFEAGDALLINYDFPILKRKFFVERRTDIARIQNVIRFLCAKKYDIYMVIEKIKRLYGISIGVDDESYTYVDIDVNDYAITKYEVSYRDIEKFITDNSDIFIYGTGHIASLIWGVFCRSESGIHGFVKSVKDGQDMFHGYPVKCTDELTGSEGIIVALNEENSRQVRERLKGFNALYIL